MTRVKLRLIRTSEGKTWGVAEDDGTYITVWVMYRGDLRERVMRHREYDDRKGYPAFIPVKSTKEEWTL